MTVYFLRSVFIPSQRRYVGTQHRRLVFGSSANNASNVCFLRDISRSADNPLSGGCRGFQPSKSCHARPCSAGRLRHSRNTNRNAAVYRSRIDTIRGRYTRDIRRNSSRRLKLFVVRYSCSSRATHAARPFLQYLWGPRLPVRAETRVRMVSVIEHGAIPCDTVRE